MNESKWMLVAGFIAIGMAGTGPAQVTLDGAVLPPPQPAANAGPTRAVVAAGGDMELIGFVGNAVGAMKVEIVGHRQSIEKIALLKYLTALLK